MKAPRTAINSAWIVDKFWTPLGVLTIVAVYAAVHFGLRFALSPTLGLDDAAQAVLAQDLRWGYQFRQPPLYTWVTWAAFQIFGVGLFALTLVKYLVLFAGYAFLYAAARNILKQDRLAALTLFSYSLIYVFAYYAHHDLTHSIAAGTMIAAALHAITRIVERGGWLDYAYLGITFGLGLLSKYNFAIFLAAVALAAFLVPDMRRRVLNRKIWLTVAVNAAVITPYVLWVYEGTYSFAALTATVTHAGGNEAYGEVLARGFLKLASALVEFPMPFLLIAPLILPALVWPPRVWTANPQGYRRFLGIVMLAGVVIFILGVILLGATKFKGRWMYPALMVLPIFLFAGIAIERLSVRRVRAYLGVILAVSVLVFAVRVVADHVHPTVCKACRAFLPYAALAEQIRAGGFARGVILADTDHLAGNLLMLFPASRVISANKSLDAPPPGVDDQCLMVWRGDSESIPATLRAFAGRALSLNELPFVRTGWVNAGLVNAEHRRRAFSFALIEGAAGNCL